MPVLSLHYTVNHSMSHKTSTNHESHLHHNNHTALASTFVAVVWLNGRAFAHDPKGREFEPRPVRFQVIALVKLLTRMCLCHQAV